MAWGFGKSKKAAEKNEAKTEQKPVEEKKEVEPSEQEIYVRKIRELRKTSKGLSEEEVLGHLRGLKTDDGKIKFVEYALGRKNIVSPKTTESLAKVGANIYLKKAKAYSDDTSKFPYREYEMAAELYEKGKMPEKAIEILKSLSKPIAESLKSDFSKLAHQLKNLDNATHLLKKLEQPEEAISIYTDKVNLLGSFMKKRDLNYKEKNYIERELKESFKNALKLARETRQQEKVIGLVETVDDLVSCPGDYFGSSAPVLINNLINESAKQYIKEGQPKEAAALFEYHGKVEEAADVLSKANMPDEAKEVYLRKAKNIAPKCLNLPKDNPNYSEYAVYLAELYQKGGQEDTALDILEKKEIWHPAAKIYEKRGELKKAAELYEKSNFELKAGEIYEALGDLDKAADMYEKGGKVMKSKRLRKSIDSSKKEK